MFDSLGEFNEKLHKRLKTRLIFLGAVALVIACILTYDVVVKNLRLIPVIGFASFGFILGFFLFVRLNKITWDAQKAVATIGKFDIGSFVVLVLYITYRISIEYFLKSHYHNDLMISGMSLSTIFGGMLGRLVSMVWIVEQTHREEMLKAQITAETLSAEVLSK